MLMLMLALPNTIRNDVVAFTVHLAHPLREAGAENRRQWTLLATEEKESDNVYAARKTWIVRETLLVLDTALKLKITRPLVVIIWRSVVSYCRSLRPAVTDILRAPIINTLIGYRCLLIWQQLWNLGRLTRDDSGRNSVEARYSWRLAIS